MTAPPAAHWLQVNSDEALTLLILEQIPPGPHLEVFCELEGVFASTGVATAAIERRRRPRLLINLDWVRQHCASIAHLKLLVLHELGHELSSHRVVYPPPVSSNGAEAVALDAVINAGLSRHFPDTEHLSLFRDLYAAEVFCDLLLRPPEGWPSAPVYPAVGPAGTQRILERLYPPGNVQQDADVSYDEIVDLFKQHQTDQSQNQQTRHPPAPPMPGVGSTEGQTNPGDTDGSSNPSGSQDDSILDDWWEDVTEMLDVDINEASASSPALLGGHDSFAEASTAGNLPGSRPWATRGGPGTRLRSHTVKVQQPAAATRRAFAQILRQMHLKQSQSEMFDRLARASDPQGARGVLPNPRDRQIHLRRRLGLPALYVQPEPDLLERPQRPIPVYLDVSESTFRDLPPILGLLPPYVRQRQIILFQFSTEVRSMSYVDLQAGTLSTTQGTAINCVVEHALSLKPPVYSALVMTDGEFGSASDALLRQMKRQPLSLHVVLIGAKAKASTAGQVAASIRPLPL